MQTILYKEMIAPGKINNAGHKPEGSILKVLAYFDIFQYPLLKNEIRQFLDQTVSESILDKALQQLLHDKNIFKLGDFYSLQNNFLLAEKRISVNRRAEKLLPSAMKIGRFLFRFPYVRAVGISGSLSKHCADEKADIDFFIITKANRLWIARTIMHIFKKFTFLTGRQHFYCMNYYVDETALSVEYKNIYVAIEIKTLLRVCGKEMLDNFFVVNNWTSNFFPVHKYQYQGKKEPTVLWFKKITEWLFNNKTGSRLDDYLMKITTGRWK